MEETVRYTYRLRPGANAERTLLDEWHRCRFLWNEAVHQQKSGRRPTFCRLSKLLTEARARSVWLREGSQVAQQQTLRTYAQSLDHAFKVKGRRKPVVKRRKSALPTVEYTVRGFRIRDRRLCLPGNITIPVVWSRDLPSEPTSVRVYRDSLGHWYASFVVRRDVEPLPEADGSVGIDWGVTTTATASDDRFDLPYGGHRRRCAAELGKAQRRMARRRGKRGQTPSKGYGRAKRDAAKLHKRAQRQNTHAARVWAKRVVAENQTIAIENLRLAFLGKTTMARKAQDAAIGVARRELIERATRAGRTVVMVEPAYTTMTCASCGARAKQRLALSERVFRCEFCGAQDTRDRNAARVILDRAERGPAGADDVRHVLPPPKGVGVQSEPGISSL